MVAKEVATSPEINAGIACAPPLNGTCSMLTFAIVVNSAPLKYRKLPEDAYESSPGFARASAISSRMFLAGTDGCATIMFGNSAVGVIAAKSLSGSYDGFA